MQTLVVVDVQPSYASFFPTKNYAQKIVWLANDFDGDVLFLYNGPELGYEDEDTLVNYYINNGLREDNNFTFVEKSYGWLRYAIDSMYEEGFDEDQIVELFALMLEVGANTSQELTTTNWKRWMRKHTWRNIMDHLRDADDMIYVPDVLDNLRSISDPITLVGGAENECLLEVDLTLRALGKNPKTDTRYVYRS